VENRKNVPKAKILRSETGAFIGAYPIDERKFPTKYPCEDMFLHSSVASAQDCTGIAVVQPETQEAADELENISGARLAYHGEEEKRI